MKIVSRLIAALTLVALTGSVFAQSVSVGSVSGQIGNQVILEPSFTAGAQEVDVVQFVVTFANPALANFSAVTVSATCGGTLGTNNQCVVSPTAEAFQVIVSNGTNAMPTGILASITFTIDGAAAAGDVALVVDPASIVIGRDGAPADPPVPVTDGNIEISTGPQPEFTGTPAGLAMATELNLADPTGSLTVTNTGEATSLLTGTCSLLAGGDSQITMSNGAFTDIAVGAAGSTVGVACDASFAAGSYAATLSCTHNGSNASPAEFPVTCEIAPPGAAMYQSSPWMPGETIEMTPDGDVPVGATVPDQVLTITNGATDANDNDLVLSNCALTGGGDISVAGPGSTTIAPTASTMVTFSCSAATVAAHTGTYSCDYDTDGDGSSDGSASYTVNCGVRTAASDLEPSTAPVNIVVPVFGTGQNSVTFTEILDEGVDATVDSCSFADGSYFTVVSALPVTVTAGSTVTIVVEGTDPADGSISVNDDLTCTYTDSDSTPGTASWPVTLTVQSAAIPTLSSWGLMLMILTMLGLGGIVIRRKTLS